MKHLVLVGSAVVSFLAIGALGACGGGGTATGGEGGGTSSSSGSSSSGASSSSSGASSSSSGTSSSSSGASSSSSGASSSSSSSGSTSSSSSSSSTSSGAPVADPAQPGPYPITEVDDTIASVPGGDTSVPVHCAYPSGGPTAGPYPVVVVGHGMQIPANQYYSYVRRLATFGYVALTVDFPASLLSVDNTKGAKDLLAGIDWAVAHPSTKADGNTAGMSGHSLGGKTSLLAATMDPRVKAAFALDPVDGGGPLGCNPPGCVDVSALMPNLHIPTGFVGETTDAMGGFQPCAPAADNFTTFYAGTNSPSLSVTAINADHMSFVDDRASCPVVFGFNVCSQCAAAATPAPDAQVSAMTSAFMVAFYERHLRGNTGYDTYLTGAQAQARYVTTGQATIASK